MKLLSKIVLLLFIAFLATPTLVTLIKKNSNTTVFYSFAEEEIHKDLKEVKSKVKQHFDYLFLQLKIQRSTTIISVNLLHHDYLSSEIISPPPKFI